MTAEAVSISITIKVEDVVMEFQEAIPSVRWKIRSSA